MSIRFVRHTADIKFVLKAPSQNRIFSEGARAFGMIVSGKKRVRATEKRRITVKGNDMNALLYQFFEELIYLVDVHHFLAVGGTFTLTGTTLQGICTGIPSREEHTALKAATYADMEMKQSKQGWEAQIVLDV